LEDYVRALKAAKRMGVKAVRIEVAGATIVMPLDDAYIEKLPLGQSPAPDVESGGKPKLVW
jgi:hypothetical protein